VRVLVSGGSGIVGRYIVNGLIEAGYSVTVGGRTPPPSDWFVGPTNFVPLGLDPDDNQSSAFAGVAGFVHAAFDHLPGQYRSGEGNDPDRFRRLNLDGTVRLFQTAKAQGVKRAVFLSSRAVYDGLPANEPLGEDIPLAPTSLYGQLKLKAEQALAELSGLTFSACSLRLTGVYGPLRPNKWDALFADYLAGRAVAPRSGSEVHGADVAAAVRLMLEQDSERIGGQTFNVSDIVTGHSAILAPLKTATGCPHPLPPRASLDDVAVMSIAKIRALGWKPGGMPLLDRTLAQLAASTST
jgi:UDP-glucose 4-epimerase